MLSDLNNINRARYYRTNSNALLILIPFAGGMYQPNYMDEQLESRVVTSVVTTQPQIKPMAFPVRIQAGEWDHALCDSCGDASACCIAMCCPCLIHKDIAAHIGQNESCCFFWSCIAYFFPPVMHEMLS